MKKIACFLYFLLSYFHGSCQSDSMWRSDYVCHKTINTSTRRFRLEYTASLSDDLWSNKLVRKYKDEIFDANFNDFSLLKFIPFYGESFTIPTIPLTHIFILESKKVIIGLSNYSVGPYNIVIYSMDGQLLFKLECSIFSVKVNSKELKSFVALHPQVCECFRQSSPVFKDGNDYHLEMFSCIGHVFGDDKAIYKYLVPNTYFPNLGNSTAYVFDPIACGFSELVGFFNDSDPLYDLLMVGSTPYLLILTRPEIVIQVIKE